MRSPLFLLIHLLLVFPSIGLGDVVYMQTYNGSQQILENVRLESMTRKERFVYLNFADEYGKVESILKDQIFSIQIGDDGAGDYFDIIVRVEGDKTLSTNTILNGFKDGFFYATPPGFDQPSALNAQNFEFIRRVVPAEAGFTMSEITGIDDFESGGDDYLSYYDINEDGYSQDIFAEEDVIIQDEWGMLQYILLSALEEEGISPALFFFIMGASVVVLILHIINTIILTVHAFSNEQAVWGVVLIICFFCCCSPVKGLYVGKYDGGGRGVVTGMVTVELVLYIALRVIDWTIAN